MNATQTTHTTHTSAGQVGEEGLLQGLASIALLGTERRPFSTEALSGLLASLETRPLAEALVAIRTSARSAEEALGLCAALVARYERAGFVPIRNVAVSDVDGSLGPADAEMDPGPPSVAASGLLDVLTSGTVAVAGQNNELIERWLTGCVRHGKRADYRQIVSLLERATTNSELRPMVAEAIGDRGRFVAARNPNWAWVGKVLRATTNGPKGGFASGVNGGVAAHAVGGTGGASVEGSAGEISADGLAVVVGDGRAALLARWRRIDPTLAAAAAREHWASENAAERVSLLTAFEVGLSADDEPFLESLLDDKAKTVRAAAQRLLAALSQSRWLDRMHARIEKVAQVKSGLIRKSLEFVLPEETDLDASWTSDGLQVLGKGTSSLGPRAFALDSLLTLAPLSSWTALTARTPEQLVELAGKSDLHKVLVAGWVAAAISQGNETWALVLLELGAAPQMQRPLASALRPATLNAYLLRALNSRQDLPSLIPLITTVGSLSDETANALLARCEKEPKNAAALEYVLPSLCGQASSRTLDRLVEIFPGTANAIRHIKAAQSLREAIDKEFP